MSAINATPDRRTADRRVSPAVGELAIQECARLRPLAQFALAVLEESRSELADLDGGWIQDQAEKLGLLVCVPVTEPCGDECRCDDFPQDCLRYSDAVAAAIAKAQS